MRSPKAEVPVIMPTIRPMMLPTTKPVAIRAILAARLRPISPFIVMVSSELRMPLGAGRKRAETKPLRQTASQRPKRQNIASAETQDG